MCSVNNKTGLVKKRFIPGYSGFLVFVFLLFIPSGRLSCQDYSFREYGVKDGLPQSQANSIFQDSRGFLWIGTKNGLSRFDGIDFINYFRKDGLPSNIVSQVFEDNSKDIWALCTKGISKYTGNGFKFYPPGNDFDKTDFIGPVSSSDQDGKIFIVSRNRISAVNSLIVFENGVYRDYSRLFPALDTIKFSYILYDSTSSDLLIYDSLGFFLTWKKEELIKLPLQNKYTLTTDRGKILLWNADTIVEYRGRKIFPYLVENNTGRSGVPVNFSGNARRVKYFDGISSTIVNLPNSPAGIYIDSDGTLWFPSDNNLFRLISTAFTSLTNDILKMRNLWAICMDKNNNLWLGSLEGDLIQYDGITFRERTDHKKLFSGNVAFFKGSRLLSNGEMWLSLNLGVIIWDGKTLKKLNGIPEEAQVCYIYEDPDNHKVILGTSIGVYIITGKNIEFLPQFNPAGLGVIEGIVKDDSGFYWMSGQNGLVKFDGINSVKINDPILPQAFTYTIEKDRYGGIWISSDEGLFCKRKSENNFRHGLPDQLNRPANTVKILDYNHLLVGRGGDLCLIDLDRYYNDEIDYYRIYDKSDGFLGGECLDNGIIDRKDGTFMILTSDGIVRFDPGKLRKNKNPPSTHFTGIYYETDSLSWEPVKKDDFYHGIPGGIILERHQNNIRIAFTGISTTNPEKVKFVYKLEGFDSKWSLPKSIREVFYDNLMPGQYSFLLKGINSDGVENPEQIKLNFRLQPAVWETTIFKIFSIIFSIVITILLTGYVLKRNQRLREEKQKISSELIKLQIGAVLKELDPHFTFNAISSIGYLIMNNRKQEALSYLTRLSSLLRTILYDGSAIIRPLSEELEFVRNYCELQILRFEEKFTYNISVGEDVDLLRVIPKMAIQIFVENSIKHGFANRQQGGNIEINLSRVKSSLVIAIRDNGIGQAASKKLNTSGSGYGIKTVKRIFEITDHYNELKSTVEIRDLTVKENGSGTEVVLRIPDNYNFTMSG